MSSLYGKGKEVHGIDIFLKNCYLDTRYSCEAYPCLATAREVSLMSRVRHRSRTQVVERPLMGERGLLKRLVPVVLSSLSFTDGSDVRCLDQAWLSKATDIVGSKVGNIRQGKKRPAEAGLFFGVGSAMFIVALSGT